jgi:hypothetical protein
MRRQAFLGLDAKTHRGAFSIERLRKVAIYAAGKSELFKNHCGLNYMVRNAAAFRGLKPARGFHGRSFSRIWSKRA